MQGHPQASVGTRRVVTVSHVPAAVELVVRVQRETVVEAGQQGLAAAVDGVDDTARQNGLVAAQPGQAEADLDDSLSDERFGDSIGFAAYFGAFGHDDDSAWIEVVSTAPALRSKGCTAGGRRRRSLQGVPYASRKETASPREALRRLRPAHALASALGGGLGGSPLLFAALPSLPARPRRRIPPGSNVTWPPTRAAGLERLAGFLPSAGDRYRRLRNFDFGPQALTHVSGLSPYLRCRLVREDEVLAAVHERFLPEIAEKFIQEVYWRSYWKGWLEHHPSAWWDYRDRVETLLAEVAGD